MSLYYTRRLHEWRRGGALLRPYIEMEITTINQIHPSSYNLNLQEEFAGVVARVESLRGRMGESTRQVENLFESLLAESFGD